MKVATHVHPDLDSIFSVLTAKHAVGPDAPLDIRFLPASTSDDDIPDGYRPLDIASGKGVGSALASMPESALLPPEVVAEIDQHDSTGKAVPRVPLSMIVAAVRAYLLDRGVSKDRMDARMIEAFDPIVGGLVILQRLRTESQTMIDRHVRIMDVGEYKFAVPDRDITLPQSAGEILSAQGVAGSVYHDGENLGVFRFPGVDEPDLTALAPHLKGWFLHPNGFLVCWGSKKAPATNPPPTGTPQDQAELLALLERLF